MLIRTLPTTLLQIFCKIIPNSKVIVKSIIAPDNNFPNEALSINGLRKTNSKPTPSPSKKGPITLQHAWGTKGWELKPHILKEKHFWVITLVSSHSTFDCSQTCRNIILEVSTLMLVVANLANTKWCKKKRKMTETLAMGTHLRVLSEYSNEYQHDRVQMVFKNMFISLCLGRR